MNNQRSFNKLYVISSVIALILIGVQSSIVTASRELNEEKQIESTFSVDASLTSTTQLRTEISRRIDQENLITQLGIKVIAERLIDFLGCDRNEDERSCSKILKEDCKGWINRVLTRCCCLQTPPQQEEMR